MILTKEIILEEVENDKEQAIKWIVLSKELWTDKEVFEKRYSELCIIEKYIESLHDITDEQEEKNLALNKMNYV